MITLVNGSVTEYAEGTGAVGTLREMIQFESEYDEKYLRYKSTL